MPPLDSDKQKEIEDEIAKTLALGDAHDDDDATDVTDESTDTVSVNEDEGEGKDATSDSAQSAVLKSKLAKLGYDVDDDMTEEELADALFERLERFQQRETRSRATR